jgi:hypothetical protein
MHESKIRSGPIFDDRISPVPDFQCNQSQSDVVALKIASKKNGARIWRKPPSFDGNGFSRVER